ncbi:TPA: hypothetical protein MHS36_28335 [Klebsiella pneumoniae]|nr:hypothetical protein FDK24_28480 [Klebsiella pneumoniae]HBX2255757.1 hypothetical protein [Klebsiella pneumoniae]
MGSCAAPSAKGDDKFITTDYLQQCPYHHLFRRSNQAFKGTNNCLKKITPRPATHCSTVVIH